MAQRIAIVNFKGGVGKTTLAIHLGCYLSIRNNQQARVLLVDVDHQSSLSIIVMDPGPWEAACNEERTLNRIFQSYTVQGIPMPGAELITPQPFGRTYPTVSILPSQFELDDTEIELAATTIGNAFVSEWKKRTLLCRWLEESGTDSEFDYIVFDCPPATKIVTQNAIAASHAYAVPVIPDAISTRGVTHFVNLVSNRIDARLKGYADAINPSEVPSTFVRDTQLAGIVISMAQTSGAAATGYTNEHWNQMSALRRAWSTDVLEHITERGTGVAESLGSGWPVFDQQMNVNVQGRGFPAMFRAVCEELITRLGW